MLYRSHKSNRREDRPRRISPNVQRLFSGRTVQSIEHLEDDKGVYNGGHPGKNHVSVRGGAHQAKPSVGSCFLETPNGGMSLI